MLAHRLMPNEIAQFGALHAEMGNRDVEDQVSVGKGPRGGGWAAC